MAASSTATEIIPIDDNIPKRYTHQLILVFLLKYDIVRGVYKKMLE